MFTVQDHWEAYIKFTLRDLDAATLEDLKRVYFSGAASILNMMNRMEEHEMDNESVAQVFEGVTTEVITYEQQCNGTYDGTIDKPSGMMH